jgi:hypothetical protein
MPGTQRQLWRQRERRVRRCDCRTAHSLTGRSGGGALSLCLCASRRPRTAVLETAAVLGPRASAGGVRLTKCDGNEAEQPSWHGEAREAGGGGWWRRVVPHSPSSRAQARPPSARAAACVRRTPHAPPPRCALDAGPALHLAPAICSSVTSGWLSSDTGDSCIACRCSPRKSSISAVPAQGAEEAMPESRSLRPASVVGAEKLRRAADPLPEANLPFHMPPLDALLQSPIGPLSAAYSAELVRKSVG